MRDSVLRYTEKEIEDLKPSECTLRKCQHPDCSTHWRVWFQVRDEIGANKGTLVVLCVGLNVGGAYSETDGPESRRWGFTRVGPGEWQVEPSINVTEVWHHTPLVTGVPESWPSP